MRFGIEAGPFAVVGLQRVHEIRMRTRLTGAGDRDSLSEENASEVTALNSGHGYFRNLTQGVRDRSGLKYDLEVLQESHIKAGKAIIHSSLHFIGFHGGSSLIRRHPVFGCQSPSGNSPNLVEG